MLEGYFRPMLQSSLLNPCAFILIRARVSPNSVTFAALILGVLVWPALVFGYPWVGLMALWGSGFLDTLDGSIARITSSCSAVGSVLDILSDRIVEATVVLGLYAVSPDKRALLALLMMASILFCVTSFLMVGIFTENKTFKSFYYSPGLIERAEAFLFFSAMMIFPDWFDILVISFCILVWYTAIIRVYQFIVTANRN